VEGEETSDVSSPNTTLEEDQHNKQRMRGVAISFLSAALSKQSHRKNSEILALRGRMLPLEQNCSANIGKKNTPKQF